MSNDYGKCKTFDEKKNSSLVKKFVEDVNVSVYAVSPDVPIDRILVASSLKRKDKFGKIRFVVFSGLDFLPKFKSNERTPDKAVNKLHYEYRGLDYAKLVKLADAIVIDGDADELSRTDVKKVYDMYKKSWECE